MFDAKKRIAEMKSSHLLPDNAVCGIVSVACKQVQVEGREIVGIATSDRVDCADEVVLPDGADTTYIDANKNLFVDHDYSVHSWVGRIRRLWRVGNTWMYRAHLFEGTRNPISEDMLTIAKQADIGASIGFEAMDWGPPSPEERKRYPAAKSIVRRWKWVELSLTPMPCNVDCQGRVSMVGERARIGDLVTKSAIGQATARMLGYGAEPQKPADRKTIVLLD